MSAQGRQTGEPGSGATADWQGWQTPRELASPGAQSTQTVEAAFGSVPGGQAEHERPSTSISLSAQASQNVEWSRKVHWLPASHGFSAHVATPAPPNTKTAVENSSTGASMLVLVIRTLRTDVRARDAPFDATLVRKTLSLMTTLMGPPADIAPPLPLLTRNGVLDHIGASYGQQHVAAEQSSGSVAGSQPAPA